MTPVCTIFQRHCAVKGAILWSLLPTFSTSTHVRLTGSSLSILVAECVYYAGLSLHNIKGIDNEEKAVSVAKRTCDTFVRPAARDECHAFISQPGVIADLVAKTPVVKMCAKMNSCAVVA